MSAVIDDHCRQMYAAARARFNDAPLGFKILYGPPYHRPPIMFVGFQPGGNKNRLDRHKAHAEREGWPEACEYAREEWFLARRMQSMFGCELLSRCVGTNAIFVRSPRLREYARQPRPDRDDDWRFCRPHVETLIRLLEPTALVLIGFSTARLFEAGFVPVLRSPRGRVLIQSGEIVGRLAMTTLHLSGALISRTDRAAIAKHVIESARG